MRLAIFISSLMSVKNLMLFMSWLNVYRRRKMYVPAYSWVLSHSMFGLVEYFYELTSLRKKEIFDESSVCSSRVPRGAVRVSVHLFRQAKFLTRNCVFDEHFSPKFNSDVDLTFLHVFTTYHDKSLSLMKKYFVLIVIVWVYVEYFFLFRLG